MRNVKFRGWHKGYDSPKSDPVMLHEDRPGRVLTWLAQGQPLEVMQFTGLRDKNGREIYEGDVVRLPIPDEIFKAVVIFKEGAFEADRPMGGAKLRPAALAGNLEVIGNIYENPELLEARHD